ncbi:UNVERIFIED_CONTAM: hypothetical protein FKN15_001760 [Acipenser sinensis]
MKQVYDDITKSNPHGTLAKQILQKCPICLKAQGFYINRVVREIRPGRADDLNMTHQHCVLAGARPRFSSTHRVAECSAGTLEYIFGRCQVALNNLHKDPSSERPSLVSLETSVLKQAEEIHNEVEFEWLRQYWFQGRRYAKFSDWWCTPMERLEECWREMELMVSEGRHCDHIAHTRTTMQI